MSDQADNIAEVCWSELSRRSEMYKRLREPLHEQGIQSIPVNAADFHQVVTSLIRSTITAPRELVSAVNKFLNGGFPHTDLCKQSWDIPYEDRISWRTKNGVICFGCNPADALRSALSAQEPKVCEWEYDEHHDKWDTACGRSFQFDGHPIQDHKYKSCPECVGIIKIKES